MTTMKIFTTVMCYLAISNSIVVVNLQIKQFNITAIQVYVPTFDYTVDEVEELYGNRKKATEHVTVTDIVIFMGNWNAKVGSGRNGSIAGQYV